MLHTVRLIAWPFLLPLVRSINGKENAQMSIHHSNKSQRHIEPSRSTADVHAVNHHSIVLFHLNTREASAWVEENVASEAQFFGTALVVEPRYVAALVAGMREDGLEVR
jgi:hypothetical protein